jgi:predicted small lipoprotein YifL
MKTLAVLLMAMLIADTLAACGDGGNTSSAVVEPPAKTQVTGVTTPQSVAVVTAN